MKLILHMGMPKTGSTALQYTLARARPRLLEAGVLYPEVASDQTYHHILSLFMVDADEKTAPITYGHMFSDNASKQRALESNWLQICRQVVRHRPEYLILSAEQLFWRFNTTSSSPETCSAFIQRLQKLTDDIQVVVYIRQPSQHYLSSTQQRLKHAGILPEPGPLAVRATLENIEQLFGNSPLVLPYHREQLQGGDITLDFFKHCLPDIKEPQRFLSPGVHNDSLSAESMSIMQRYHATIYPDQARRYHSDSIRLTKLLQRLECDQLQGTKPRLKPGIAKYIDHASVDLLWLRDRYDLIFPMLDYSAIKPADTNPYQHVTTVEDICELDTQLRDRMLMQALHTLLKGKGRIPTAVSRWFWRNQGRRGIRSLRQLMAWLRARTTGL